MVNNFHDPKQFFNKEIGKRITNLARIAFSSDKTHVYNLAAVNNSARQNIARSCRISLSRINGKKCMEICGDVVRRCKVIADIR